MGEMVRFYICAALILIGLIFMISGMFGVFKFKYVLNRLHASALGDTMGLFFIVLGLAVAQGVSFISVKLVIMVVIFWMTSPVSTHMIARLELETNEDLDKEVTEWTR